MTRGPKHTDAVVERGSHAIDQAQSPGAVSTPAGDPMLLMIERAARDPQIDVEKMERLWKLRQEAVAQRAAADFNADMALVQAEMPAIVRDAENSSTGSMYARLETVQRLSNPVIARHGFSISFNEVLEGVPEGFVRVSADVRHRAGHTAQYHTEVPLDTTGARGNVNKTLVHGKFSSTSYARRYLLTWIFNIPIGGQDDDGNAAGSGDVVSISEEQAAELTKLMETAKANERFLQFFNVTRIEDLPADQFKKAKQVLNDRIKQSAKA